MAALDQNEAKRLLDAALGKVAYVAPTTPMKLALTTTIPTTSAAGTEVTGGGYARQTFTAATVTVGAGGASTSNDAVINFTNMPDTTAASVKGANVYDSAGSPRRALYGSLTTPRTTAAGDTLSFAIGAITLALG